jgi:dipeptidyl aminopeptidase/acylaminoacyl peptidase
MNAEYLLSTTTYQGKEAERNFLSLYKKGPRPKLAVMYIHGHASSAWQSLNPWATELANAGYLAILPTLVGYLPKEKSDYGGPKTIADLRIVIEAAKAQLEFDHLAVWGISRGAMAAALLAADMPNTFDAVVLQSGIYDFKTFTETTLPGIKESIHDEVELNDQAIKQRTCLEGIAKTKAPILVLHGNEDKNVPVQQAKELERALRDAGRNDEVHIISGEHMITRGTLKQFTLPFLEANLSK